MRSLWGLLAAMTSTAATNGVLPAAPRPRWPLRRFPPQQESTTWTTPARGTRSSRSQIACMSLCLNCQAMFWLTPSLAGQFKGRDATLRLRHEMDRQEPDGEREPRAGEERGGTHTESWYLCGPDFDKRTSSRLLEGVIADSWRWIVVETHALFGPDVKDLARIRQFSR